MSRKPKSDRYTFTPSPELLAKLQEPSPDCEGREMNLSRARWAEAPLCYFSQITGSDMDGDDPTALGDLLGDLMHYCDVQEIDFEETLQRARRYYYDEKHEEEIENPTRTRWR